MFQVMIQEVRENEQSAAVSVCQLTRRPVLAMVLVVFPHEVAGCQVSRATQVLLLRTLRRLLVQKLRLEFLTAQETLIFPGSFLPVIRTG